MSTAAIIFFYFFSEAVNSSSRRQERTIVRSQVRTSRRAWCVSTNNCEYCQAVGSASSPILHLTPKGYQLKPRLEVKQ